MNLTCCYTSGSIKAYTFPGRCDFAVLFDYGDNPIPPSDTVSAETVFQSWKQAALGGGGRPLRRSLLFFPRVSPAPELSYAAQFAKAAASGRNPTWGTLAYWCDGAQLNYPIRVLSGQLAIATVKQFQLGLLQNESWGFPSSLDDFSYSYDAARDLLKISAAPWKWTAVVDQGSSGLEPFASSNNCFINFSADYSFEIGALSVEMIPTGLAVSPVEISYSVLQSLSRRKSQRVTAMKGRIFADGTNGDEAAFVIDPRDSDSSVTAGSKARSRIEFQTGSRWKTNFVNHKGQRAFFGIPSLAESTTFGYAQLQLEMSTESGNGVESTMASFVPCQDFKFLGVDGILSSTRGSKIKRQDDEASVHRLMLGNTPSEHAVCRVGDIFKFVPGQGAVLCLDANGHPPSDDGLFSIDNGRVTTSWLTILRSVTDSVKYVTEPSTSPLFSVEGLPRSVTQPLTRAHPASGEFKANPRTFVPVFPWMGSEPTTEPANSAGLTNDYETSHLAEMRRRKLLPQPGGKMGNKRKGKRKDAATTIGVTPQGIVAQVTDSNFTGLYFGDPDAMNTGSSAGEFTIAITPANANSSQDVKALSDELQRDLRRNDLFLVMAQPEDYFSKVVTLTGNCPQLAQLGIGGFQFALDWSQTPNDGILILKYYKGLSVQQLLSNPALWACKKHLAPTLSQDAIVEATAWSAKVSPENWNAAFENPDWQGVLFLNFAPAALSDMVEALGAGMDMRNLRFHHFGLPFLPINARDISQGCPPPVRIGPAFALLHYSPIGAQPPPTGSDELYEPVDGKTGPSGPTTTKYDFTVNNLDVEFVNARISNFNAEVDLSFSHFFWDTASVDGKTVELKLTGSYQAKGGNDAGDSFRLTATNVTEVDFNGSLLDKLVITDAEFIVTAAQAVGNQRQLTSFIGFKADLYFNPNEPFFELVQVEKVHMEQVGLEIDYTYTKSTDSLQPKNPSVECRFRADGVQVVVQAGELANSLMSLCPLKLKGFRVAIQSPFKCADLGYLALPWPSGGDSAEAFDFAFDLELDLGSMGGLSTGGSGLQFPLLLGWRKHGLGIGFGIQFPKLNMDNGEFEIGIDQFIAIQATGAVLQKCPPNGSSVNALAFALHDVHLVFFGKQWPPADSDTKLDLALFIGTDQPHKIAWIFGVKDTDSAAVLSYVAAGQRVKQPDGGSAEDIIKNSDLAFPSGSNICNLSTLTDPSHDGWLVMTAARVLDVAQFWLALSDNPQLYALTIDILELFTVGATYKRVNDKLGAFSAEVNLANMLPPLEFGAASVRLPKIRTEVYTDGGWLLDLGYPWNNDFTGGCQMELGIFLGTAGLYFGYTAAMATDALLLSSSDAQNGFNPPDATDMGHNAYISSLHAIRAGIALRVGIGRSIDIGVLSGEVSLTVYGTLEGAAVIENQNSSTGVQANLYAYQGVVGIMLQITAELDFLVLQATADLVAYIQTGISICKVLGEKDKEFYAINLPLAISAEIGIHLHFEVWVTIGCVRVKLFDLNFNATWGISENIGDFDPGKPLPDKVSQMRLPGVANNCAATSNAWTWNPYPPRMPFRRKGKNRPFTLFAVMVPCVGDPADFNLPAGQPVSCMVGQLMLDVENEFAALAKFMAAWALGLADPDTNNPQIYAKDIASARSKLRGKSAWTQQVIETVKKQFDPVVSQAPPGDAMYSIVPAWPDITWQLEGGPSIGPGVIQVPKGWDLGTSGEMNAAEGAFLDYLQLTTRAMLSEFARQIQTSKDPVPGYDPEKNDNFLNWADICKNIGLTS